MNILLRGIFKILHVLFFVAVFAYPTCVIQNKYTGSSHFSEGCHSLIRLKKRPSKYLNVGLKVAGNLFSLINRHQRVRTWEGGPLSQPLALLADFFLLHFPPTLVTGLKFFRG